MIKFSIIVPLFNKENYILDSIYSVLSQNYTCFELICINDCSTDNSLQKIEKIEDDRLKIFNNTVNSGVSYSRNFGILNSTGDYIIFLDADDKISPNYLEQIAIFINKSNENLDLIVSNWIYNNKLVVDREYIDLLDFALGCPLFSQLTTYVFKKRFLLKSKITFNRIMKLGEDKEFLIRCFLSNPRFKFYNCVGLLYNDDDIFSLSRNYKFNNINLRNTFFYHGFFFLPRSFINFKLLSFLFHYYKSNYKLIWKIIKA